MMNLENNDRFPLIPLDYKQRHLAKARELVIDNERGVIYIASAKDPSILINVTQQILNLISTDMSADNMILEVEGQGRVNLKEYISYLRANMLKAETFGGKKCLPSYGYDFSSITNRDGIIQMNNFWNAKAGYVPYVDQFSTLRWSTPDGTAPIVKVELDDANVVVLKDRFSYSSISDGVIIKLNTPEEDASRHATLFWKVECGSIEPVIYIHDDCKVYLEFGNDIYMKPNAIHIYRFETWDGGTTWFESVKKYKTSENTFNERIDLDYISTNYYTKSEVNELLEWKNDRMNSLGS